MRWMFPVAATVLVLFTIALNAASLDYGFVYDDQQVILDRKPFWEEGLATFLATRHWGTGRHLSLISLDLDRREPLSPRPFHRSNVLLAAAVVGIVFLLALQLGLDLFSAFVGALLFAVHPSHTDPVTSIVGRAQLLAAAAVLTALLVYLRGYARARPPTATELLAGGLLFFFAMNCKENAAVLPLLVLTHHFTMGSASGRGFPWSTLVAYATAFAAWLCVAFPLLGGITPIPYVDNPLAHLPVWQRVPEAAQVLWMYLGLLLYPFKLLPDRGYAVTDPGLAMGVVSLAAWIAMCVAAWRSRLRQPRVVFLSSWFIVAFAATANVVFPIGTIMSERLLYLPSVGLCLLAGAGLGRLAARGRVAALCTSALVAASVLPLAIRYDGRARVWTSSRYYHEQAAAESPRSAKAQYDLAANRQLRGDVEGAIASYRRALAIIPGFDRATFYLAELLLSSGRAYEGAQAYLDYLRVHPGDPAAITNLTRMLLAAQRPAEALTWARRLAEIDPENTAYRETLVSVEHLAAAADRRARRSELSP